MPRSRKLHASEQIISWGYGLINTKPIKLITFSLTKIIRFIRSLSLVQFVAPRQIRAEIIYLRVDLLDLRVIHACTLRAESPSIFLEKYLYGI